MAPPGPGPGTAMMPQGPGPCTTMMPTCPGTSMTPSDQAMEGGHSNCLRVVLQIARIGGKNTKDCVHKVLDRLFTNALMAKFNKKGKGKQGKRSLEKTKVYGAIKDGIMNGDEAATEDIIRIHAAEHLKHAPQRSGGHKAITQD
ncbi:hypothetical protein XENORESO_008193 [Xenotaenia resolanae]|uniref:Uncharacterized protein n=1 Tax=Xenotaenia resolanae TaxID=208358 RepID=A0ABV0X7D9_9TELE